MAVLHEIVLGLIRTRIAGETAGMAQGVEATGATGEQLVNVCLVPDIPDETVAGRIEDPVQGDRQFHDPQIGGKVATGPRDFLEDENPDLLAQVVELVGGEVLKV
jgi:hypothetical protein